MIYIYTYIRNLRGAERAVVGAVVKLMAWRALFKHKTRVARITTHACAQPLVLPPVEEPIAKNMRKDEEHLAAL
jgi:hypothetical protein